MKVPNTFIEQLMLCALEQAHIAVECGEVPVGAAIGQVVEGDLRVVAEAHNLVEKESNSTKHAEIIAIERASKVLNNWRLEDCFLCVTLEPCTMCAGAIRLARLPLIVFGASDTKMGAFGSLYDLSSDQRLGHTPRVISGIYEKECASLLKNFFSRVRENEVAVRMV